jgi:membrane protease YdiL (CAAX protease family)
MGHRQLPVPLLRREITWGLRYLLFQLVFLGALLSQALALLGLNGNSALLDATYFGANLAAVVWIFRSYLWQSLKHGISHWSKLLLAAVIGFAVYYAMIRGLDDLILWLKPEFFNVNDADIAANSRSSFLITAVGTVVLVPLAEETLYRGLIFGGLHQRNRLLAYVLSTLLFSFIHVMGYIGAYPPLQLLLCFAQYIPAGLTLAWSYEFSGSILAPVLIHTAVNAIAIYSMR